MRRSRFKMFCVYNKLREEQAEKKTKLFWVYAFEVSNAHDSTTVYSLKTRVNKEKKKIGRDNAISN